MWLTLYLQLRVQKNVFCILWLQFKIGSKQSTLPGVRNQGCNHFNSSCKAGFAWDSRKQRASRKQQITFLQFIITIDLSDRFTKWQHCWMINLFLSAHILKMFQSWSTCLHILTYNEKKILGYCLHGVSHVMPVSVWDSFKFTSIFLPDEKPASRWIGCTKLPLGKNVYVHGLCPI